LSNPFITDTNYGSGEVLLSSQNEYGVDLLCPTRPPTGWQAHTEGAFDISHFAIDWDNQQVTCPMGNLSHSWRNRTPTSRDHTTINVTFSQHDCGPCPVRERCTKKKAGARTLGFLPREQMLVLQRARECQATEAFTQRYHARAGIEGTISQAVATTGARRSRYIGLAKTHGCISTYCNQAA
jgi:hypothetical protein